MASFLRKNGKLRLSVILGAVALFIVGGLAAGKWIVWPRVKSWREQRTNNVAREKFAQGDYASAMTAIRTSLHYNSNNLDTWKLGAEISAKQKSPDQFPFLQRIALLQPTLENRLKFIRFAVENNAYPQAQEVIAKVGSEGASSAEFLKLAAQVSQRLGKNTAARGYLMSLVALRPDDNEAKFELARLRLVDGFNDNRPGARADVRNLVSDPALRERALALLLMDSLNQKNSSEAMDYADQLAANVTTSTANQLLVAETYRRYAPGKHASHLARLEQNAADNPESAVAVAGYLVNTDQGAEMNRWYDTLPEVSKNAEGVQINNAIAYQFQGKWSDMEAFLRSCKWKEMEFLRHAFLARVHRAVGNERQFSEEWRLATIELGNNLRKLQILLNRVNTWNWSDERYELLWKQFSIDPTDKTLRQQLIAWESSKGNTAGLNKLFGRIVELSPQDANSKNNFAYTSLLLGTNLDRAFEIANDNYKAEPKNPYFTTTRSLALYKQGKPQEALQAIESLDIVSLAQPDRINLHTLYLAECGRAQEAADLISSVRPAALNLPEERKLFETAQSLLARAERDQGTAARLATLSAQRGSTGANRKSWFAMLPEPLRANPSVAMELSDSFYATDDYRGLETSLKTDRWEQNDFLRFALLAYAQKNQGKDGDARASWRAALASAGSNNTNLAALTEMSVRWGWLVERIDLYSRIYQRDPQNEKVFNELADYYQKNGSTAELARVYELRCDANPGDVASRARFAYFCLLTGSNLSRAHVLAREAHDAAPEDPFRAKVYAFSLFKQGRTGDAWRTLESMVVKDETGLAQTGLLKAVILVQRKDNDQARDALSHFDESTALPEEVALKENVTQQLEKKDN
jgi:uncharacterized protein HemY